MSGVRKDVLSLSVADRLQFLSPLISEDQRVQVWDALLAKIESW